MAAAVPSSNLLDGIESFPVPKRVILRLRVNEFEGEGRSWEQHVDAIRAYLLWAGRQTSEYEGPYGKGTHFAHVEPFQAPELKQTKFHIILDMDCDGLKGPDLATVPHEVYRVLRDAQGDLYSH